MTNRRKFLKAGLVAGLAPAILPTAADAANRQKGGKHWVWIRPRAEEGEAELRNRYRKYREAGIRGAFFESDSQKHFVAAKQEGLEAHRWMWTLNRGEQSLLAAHPEWYSVNRKGESCADKPPYVKYYRWLCPSREEVAAYLEADVQQILNKDYVDGIHLDYVRYCDVVLPLNLWDTYKIEQTRELPEYDYCYCQVCQDKFRQWRNVSITDVAYPDALISWRQYRYDAVTNIVNRLALVARKNKKPITAAVFPTPEVARRNVRQDWVARNLDAICPMIYHGFYKEPVGWIGDAVTEGVNALHGKYPLYAGLYLPDFQNMAELEQGITLALQRGAGGISLFGNVSDDVLAVLQKVTVATKRAT